MKTPYDYWQERQEKKRKKKEKSEIRKFLKKEWLFTLIAISTILGLHFSKQYYPISTTTKLIIGFVLLLFFALIFVLFSAGGSAFRKKEGEEEENSGEGAVFLGGYIRDVPANKIWVLRRTLFGSDIDIPEGYFAKPEGFRIKIPLYHDDLGLVDKSPLPRDPEGITVNTKDNQTAIIDWRIVSIVTNPIVFAVKVNGNREEFENQAANVVFNSLSTEKNQDDLTSFEGDKLEDLSDEAKIKFNEKIGYLGIEAERLEIQKILMPEEIRAAAEYATVTEQRKKVAPLKAEELRIITKETEADPTTIVKMDMIRDMLTNIADIAVNAFRTYKETEKTDKGESK